MSLTTTTRSYPTNGSLLPPPSVDEKAPGGIRLRTVLICCLATGVIALAGAVALSATVFVHSGPTGARGAQGVPGLPGLAGPVGPRGRQGREGATGVSGQQGAAGAAGVAGINGANGAPAGNQDLGVDNGYPYGTAADGSACDDSPSSTEPDCPF